MKFDNDFQAFTEDRSWQIKSWKENQGYLIDFLKYNNLSQLYAYGSYYYLILKFFRFRDLNFNLLLSYLIFTPIIWLKKYLIFLDKKINNDFN